MRNLLYRQTAGIEVSVDWNPVDGKTHLTVDWDDDHKTAEIPTHLVMDAFDHPYCYIDGKAAAKHDCEKYKNYTLRA